MGYTLEDDGMPIYEYACLDCGRELEELVCGDEKPACPKCGRQRLERRMAPVVGPRGRRFVGLPRPRRVRLSHCCGPNCGMHG